MLHINNENKENKRKDKKKYVTNNIVIIYDLYLLYIYICKIKTKRLVEYNTISSV